MSKRKNKKVKEMPSQIGVSDSKNDKIKWLLDEDKIIIDKLYSTLLKYIPTDFRSELIKVHEEMMVRRERKLTELLNLNWDENW
jgi:hypothetical protein